MLSFQSDKERGSYSIRKSSQDTWNVCRHHVVGDEIDAQAPDQLSVCGRHLALTSGTLAKQNKLMAFDSVSLAQYLGLEECKKASRQEAHM